MDTNVVGIRDPLTKSHVESLTGLYLTPIGKRYVPMGFNGFYYNDIQAEPELLIINPKEFVTGAILADFEQEAIRKLFLIHNVTYGVVSAFNSVLPMCSDFELRL